MSRLRNAEPPLPDNHQCTSTCQLCGSNHQTADRTCKARYKTPYIVKHRRWERQQQDSPMPTPVSNNADQQNSLPLDNQEAGTGQDPVHGPDTCHGAEHLDHKR
ncbi:hypothetical protein MTO96_051111 [Rhipicephalus appendiculatus]